MPRYASLIYNGYWWSPERKALQVLIDVSRNRERLGALKLYKGNVVSSASPRPTGLFRCDHRDLEEDRGAYDQKDAEGFIKLNALRMRTAAKRRRKK
jgi:argininosuccinate synthase